MSLASMTLHEFRSLCNMGHLKPRALDANGHRLYHRDQIAIVAQMKDALTGRIAVKRNMPAPDAYTSEESEFVMRRLSEGATLDVIFLENPKIHPIKLRSIRAHYVEFAGGILLTRSELQQLEMIPIHGASYPLTTPAEVVNLVKLAMGEQRCVYCKAHTRAAYCTGCIRSALAAKEIERTKAEESGPVLREGESA